MVRRSNIVVSVGLNTFNSIVRIKPKLIQYLLINGVFKRHQLLTRKQAQWLFVSKLSVPWVLSDLVDAVTLIWVSLQDLGDEV